MSGGEVFGTTAAGETVHRYEISGGGLTAAVITWGAAIQDLRLEGHKPPLVLGFETLEDYEQRSPYFGAIAGRYANRIAGGRFALDGRRYAADASFRGRHLLHGGAEGTSQRVWRVAEHGPDFIRLTLLDPAGWMGFPGNLDISCTYRLDHGGRLCVGLSAETDTPTLCNLAQHSYFNLDDGGADDILDHRMMIKAAAYLPVDDDLIPTGVVQPVEGTAFDFMLPRPIRMEEGGRQIPYDHNFCLSAARGELRQAAWVQGAVSGVEMEVWTTEPGLQFYAGDQLPDGLAGLGGRRYRKHTGLCLEPQVWPDAPNRPYFPQAVLRPGETYRQTTEYRFRLG